jgi:prophage antirepressor-like protein
MKEQVTIFENAQFGQIRTSIGANGEPLFCLADVCKALGLEQSHRVKPRLQQNGVTTITVIDSMNREQKANFITEPNLYKCIFQSRKKEAEQFQDWVCGEVLPSIRKSGGYMVARADETPEQIMARALIVAQETINRQKAALSKAESKNYVLQCQNDALTSMNEGQQRTIKFLQPGATFAKAVETSEHSILVGELARIIKQNGVEIGQNRLFQWLREKGYLCKKGEMYNQPTQNALQMGLFEIKKTVITKPNGNSLVTTTTKVTGKGQIYFTNKFLYDAINETELNKQAEQAKKGGAL